MGFSGIKPGRQLNISHVLNWFLLSGALTLKNGLLDLFAGNDLPVQYLRLLAPPLQLLSAAVWQVVQQGLVDHYGMLEEFVTMVTELVPELMSYSQKAQLIMGLRARVSRSGSIQGLGFVFFLFE